MKLEADTAITIAQAGMVLLPAVVLYGIAEGLYLHFAKRIARLGEYKVGALSVVVAAAATAIVLAFMPFSATLLALVGTGYAPYQFGLDPIGFVYGLIAYEFGYWVQHWLAHNVRFLWCIHSPHHAPNSINLFVGFNHSFFESVFYFPVMLGLLPALLGVHPLVIGIISAVDVIWGNMLHLSDGVVTRRYGFLERFMQTPSYHRAHHAQNVRYMDTNYNSITLLWDWLMGTLEPLDDAEPVVYGITRDVNTSSFMDVHFGEFGSLWRDVRNAGSLRAAASYLFKPPGWSETGEHQTVAARKATSVAGSRATEGGAGV